MAQSSNANDSFKQQGLSLWSPIAAMAEPQVCIVVSTFLKVIHFFMPSHVSLVCTVHGYSSSLDWVAHTNSKSIPHTLIT